MKKVYLFLTAALLLCCFLNVAQAQTTVPVTFKVDMTGQDVTNGAFVTGTFTSTSGDDANWQIIPMTDDDGDLIYTYTADLAQGATGGYYYLNENDWPARETVPAECATMHEGTSRGYTIPADQTEPMEYAFVWASCEAIESTPVVEAPQDSVTWTLTPTGSTVVTDPGLTAVADVVESNLVVNDANTPMARVKPAEGWPAETTAPIENTYLEFTVSPAADFQWNATSFAMEIASRNNSGFKAAAYYSTDGFATAGTEILTTENLPADVLTIYSEAIDVALAEGETLTIRVYPWIDGAASTVTSGHYFLIQSVVVSGTATSTLADCGDAVIAYHQIDATGGWNEGVTEITVNPGQSIKFGPQPDDAGYTWSWKGPDGFTSEERDPLVENITAVKAGEYVAVVRGADCISSITYTVTVEEPQGVVGADLDTLMMGGVQLGGFDPNLTTYHVLLPTGTNEVTNLTANGATEGATVEVPATVDVSSGTGTAEIVVTNPDASGTKTYTVNFTVIPENNPEAKNIVFVTPNAAGNDYKDNEQIAWLIRQGFNVETYYSGSLSTTATTTPADIDMLNAADLIIIGRGVSSTDFGAAATVGPADKAAWNGLTVPVILNSQYVARDSRLNWFKHSGPTIFNPSVLLTIDALVTAPEEPVFYGVELGDDNIIPWAHTPEELIFAAEATNGTVLAKSSNTTPVDGLLFVRFAADQPFYASTTDKPAAERVYFGFGNDNSSEAPDNFFPLTEEARAVYLNEIKRLLGLNIGPHDKVTTPTPADDATGQETTVDLSWEGNGQTFTVYMGTAADNLTAVAEDIAEKTHQLTGLETSTEYFWRVDSHVPGETLEGDIWSFTTASGEGPLAKVTNMAPANNDMVELDGLALTWEGNGDTYDVYIGTAQDDLELIAEDVTETTFTPENLEANAVYFWRVDANRADETVAGDVLSFTTLTTGIADLSTQGVRIFPNPVNGSPVLTLDGAADIVSVNVYNAQGILLKAIDANNSNISINVADLPKGLYILKAVKNDRTVLSGKFVK